LTFYDLIKVRFIDKQMKDKEEDSIGQVIKKMFTEAGAK
jgi:hypothetical protein